MKSQAYRMTMLFDFYGDVLTDRQKEFYDLYYNEDLSLGEIAKEEGISRQGVHDLVRRCTKALEGYEKRLHLIEKFLHTKERVAKIHALTKAFRDSHDEAVLDQIERISNEILEEL